MGSNPVETQKLFFFRVASQLLTSEVTIAMVTYLYFCSSHHFILWACKVNNLYVRDAIESEQHRTLFSVVVRSWWGGVGLILF